VHGALLRRVLSPQAWRQALQHAMSGGPVDEPVAKRQCVEAAAADAEPAAPPDTAEAAQDGLAGGTLIVRPLPKHWDVDKLRSLLSSAGVKVASIRKKKSWPYAFLTFGFLADRVHAEAAVPKLRAEGRPLSTADASQREGGGAPAKGAKADATAEAAARATRDVRDAVSPLWAVPYEQQLQRKRATVAAALQQLSRSTKKASQGKPPQWAFGGGLACPLRGIVASPVRDCYRNKCEFSIGPCGETGLLSIGFNVGAFAEGYAAVASGERCPHVSPAARQVAAWTQAHLRATSALPFWDKRAGGGFWRLLMVREGGMALRSGAGWRNWLVTDTAEPVPSDAAAEPPPPPGGWEGQPVPRDGAEVLCVVQVSPAGHAAETVRAECAALAAALRQAAAAAHPPMPLGALLLQVHTGCSNAAPADAPLMPLDAYSEAPGGRSDGALHERLFDLRFRISPE
jgi:tRNA (uracil-5-)-methyltransferase